MAPPSLRRVALVTAAVALAAELGCAPVVPQAPTGPEIDVAREYYNEDLRAKTGPPHDAITAARNAKTNPLFLPSFYRDANAYCRNLQMQASYGSTAYATNGWLLGTLGVVGFGASTAGATADEPKGVGDASWKVAMGASMGLAVVATALGVYYLSRSSTADKAAVAAIRAQSSYDRSTDERERWKKCLEARAAWTEANSEHTNEARDTLKAYVNKQSQTGPDAGKDDDKPTKGADAGDGGDGG